MLAKRDEDVLVGVISGTKAYEWYGARAEIAKPMQIRSIGED
jgi:hypothetical protein